MVLAVATNVECAPQAFDMLKELIDLDAVLAADQDNAIWCRTRLIYDAMNYLLEFPKVFARVTASDPNDSFNLRDIDERFMEYYFAKLPQYLEKGLTAMQSELAYMVLERLITTYALRDQIRKGIKIMAEIEEDTRRPNTWLYQASKAARHFKDKYFPDPTDIHAQRIRQLLHINEINEKARRSQWKTPTVLDEALRTLHRDNPPKASCILQ